MMVEAAGRLAEGKLDQNLDYHSDDELGSLAAAFRTMIASLSGVIRETSDVLAYMAAGDLTSVVGSDFKGDLAAIKDSLNATGPVSPNATRRSCASFSTGKASRSKAGASAGLTRWKWSFSRGPPERRTWWRLARGDRTVGVFPS